MQSPFRTDVLCFSVTAVAITGAGAHAVAAGSSDGVMAWVMALMALMCLTGLAQLRRTIEAVRRVALHVTGMSGGMALAHAAWLLLAGGQDAGHQAHALAGGSGTTPHALHLLAVIAVEVTCMAAAMFLSRRATSRPDSLEPSY
jgi:hypothetical protein